MTDEAKVRIGGDAQGATRATDAVTKGLKGTGDQATKSAKQAADGAAYAAKAELQYESEVQKAIQRLKQKETQANATSEAMKRLGMESSKSTRGALAAPLGGAGGGGGGIAQGLSRLQGPAGSFAAGLANSIGSASPAIAGLGILAAGVGVSLRALSAASERQAQLAGDIVKAEQARKDIITAATKQLGANALGASAEGGAALRSAIAHGGSIAGVQALGNETGTSAGQAAQIGDVIRSVAEQDRAAVLEAVRNAVKLGVDPVQTATELAGFSARNKPGDLNAMNPLAVMMNAGNLFDNFSDSQLNQATLHGMPGQDQDLATLESLSNFSTRGSRAGLSTLNAAGVRAADDATAEDARRTADPIGTALSEHSKQLKREVDVLEAMAKGEHPLIRALNNLAAGLGRGQGSYNDQAARLRAVNGG